MRFSSLVTVNLFILLTSLAVRVFLRAIRIRRTLGSERDVTGRDALLQLGHQQLLHSSHLVLRFECPVVSRDFCSLRIAPWMPLRWRVVSSTGDAYNILIIR